MMAALREDIRQRPQAVREYLARENLIAYVKRMFPAYSVADHHWKIANALQDVERGAIQYLAITMPPRHGKSTLASEHFPPWYLGRNPDNRIIATSYAADLAYRFSRRARNQMSAPDWPFDVQTAGDLANVKAWDISDHRGGYYAAGVGGGIAGHGANLLLVDDPVASAEQADSQTYRDRAWEWFTQDAMTRLNPGAYAVILIGTRWHEDDLIGRALQMPDTRWVHLDMPAINDAGEALWPSHYPLERLEQIRSQIGAKAFTSLYQQQPRPAEGAILKRGWWQSWVALLPPMDWIVQTWDTAFKTGQENDYSACVTAGLSGGRIYVLDLWHEKVEFPDLKRAVRAEFLKWKPDEVIVEDKASGQSLIQEMRQEVELGGLWNEGMLIPIVPFNPGRDKLSRVNAASPYVEGHRVLLPAQAPWRDELVEECAAFPAGKHDDQVDAMVMAILRLRDRMPLITRGAPDDDPAFRDMPVA